MTEKFLIMILLIISAGSFAASCFYFKEKGFLLNNAYLFASKKERKEMDKKLHYRQSAVIFLLIGIIFLLNTLQMIFEIGWLFYAALAVTIAAVIYALVSTIKIEKKEEVKTAHFCQISIPFSARFLNDRAENRWCQYL